MKRDSKDALEYEIENLKNAQREKSQKLKTEIVINKLNRVEKNLVSDK